MKLAVLALVALLGTTAYAGPGGRQQRPKRKQLRALVMQHFDKNHDGHLERRERKQASRALKRLAKRMDRTQNRAAARNGRHAKMIRRFDLNGDGNLGPGEVPPTIANELRPLDRNGDGWLRGNELPCSDPLDRVADTAPETVRISRLSQWPCVRSRYGRCTDRSPWKPSVLRFCGRASSVSSR
jgi:hypothetical protein